jgi:hypothetical protein
MVRTGVKKKSNTFVASQGMCGASGLRLVAMRLSCHNLTLEMVMVNNAIVRFGSMLHVSAVPT